MNKARPPYPPRGAFATRPPTDAVEAGGEVGEITALDRPRFVEELELGVPHTRERPGEPVSSWRASEGESLALEAFARGREVGAKQVVSELLDDLFERLLETRRRYEALTPEQAEALESASRGGARSAVLEAHFGARIAALEELHAELRRIRPKGSRGAGS